MLNRDEAIILIKKYLKNVNNFHFAIAVESIMRNIAELLERDEETWGLTGLLHNLDFEYASGNPESIGILTSQLLDGLFPEQVINAIKANNYIHSDYIPITSLDKALIATVTATGFIKYVVYDSPTKKISDVELPLVITKFYETAYASNFNRNRIKLCEDIGMDVNFFLDTCLKSLKEISDDIGL
jgi:predicted hydrolase (HD superfamily)